MLKLIVMILCDSCGDSFEPVAVSCDRHPKVWQFLSDELKTTAEDTGWCFYECASLCQECTEDLPCSIDE
jgi:hypothetical protein